MTFFRKLYLFLAVLVILILAGYFSLKYSAPYILAPKIQSLVNEKLSPQIHPQNISFEPIGMILIIKDLKLADETSLKNLHIDFSMSDLFNKKITISKISLSDLNLRIIKKNDRFTIDLLNNKNLESASKTNNKNWQISIEKIEILKSEIFLLKNNIAIKKLEISNFDSSTKDNLSFKADLKFNDSNISLSGKLFNLQKSPSGNVSFKVDDFDLETLSEFLPEIDNIGKITGKISGFGTVDFNKKKLNILANSELQNLFFYSKDLQTINYFARKISFKDLAIISDTEILDIKSSATTLNNLLLSIPEKQFNIDKLSNFGKIEIANIDYHLDKKFLTTNASIDFSDGGSAQIYAQKLQNSKNLYIEIANLDLAQFSESFEYLLKYHIKSGKLFLVASTKTSKQKIKGDVQVSLSQLKLDSENELGEDLEEGSSIPLKTAVLMIKDKNGNIDFKFNIYGNENDPNFNPINILGKGAGSLIISKATTLVATKLASEFAPILLSSIPLSPSNILFLANGAYKLVTKPRFNSIKFNKMSVEISEKSQKDLDKFVDFLAKYKTLKFTICPTASILESQSIESPEKLTPIQTLELADQRITILKEFFKSKIESGLKQIVFCRPKISQTNSNISEAEISI